jgi:hypothetical protein
MALKHNVFGICLALAICVVAPAEARTIDIPATAGWKHAGSGTVLRREIAGFARESLSDSGDRELDVSAQFRSQDQSTLATIYIFRPANNSAPIWFDRSRTMIEQGDMFGMKGRSVDIRPSALDAAASSTVSGLKIVYPVSAGNFRSTALALVPAGEWILAVRITSSTLDAPSLDAKLNAVVAGIGWAANIAQAPASEPVQPCADPLKFGKAKLLPPSLGNALIDAVAGMATAKSDADNSPAKPAPLAVYCKDPASTMNYGIYRANAESDAYVMAAGDAGISVLVGPTISLGSGPRYSVVVQKLDSDLSYPSFSRLPSPDQVWHLINEARPLSSTTRNGNGTQIHLPSKN